MPEYDFNITLFPPPLVFFFYFFYFCWLAFFLQSSAGYAVMVADTLMCPAADSPNRRLYSYLNIIYIIYIYENAIFDYSKSGQKRITYGLLVFSAFAWPCGAVETSMVDIAVWPQTAVSNANISCMSAWDWPCTHTVFANRTQRGLWAEAALFLVHLFHRSQNVSCFIWFHILNFVCFFSFRMYGSFCELSFLVFATMHSLPFGPFSILSFFVWWYLFSNAWEDTFLALVESRVIWSNVKDWFSFSPILYIIYRYFFHIHR